MHASLHAGIKGTAVGLNVVIVERRELHGATFCQSEFLKGIAYSECCWSSNALVVQLKWSSERSLIISD